jgi:putative transposase
MGLSLRDLQEALYFILGQVLSVSAVNQITLNVHRQLEPKRQERLTRTLEMILVDGVWVEIQYTNLNFGKEFLDLIGAVEWD